MKQRGAVNSAPWLGRGWLAVERAKLRDVLLGTRAAKFASVTPVEASTPLNEPQIEAVSFAHSAQDIAILHGPPGTGKTTTLAEVVIQAVKRGERVLACAPSNTAVDNLLERIVVFVPSALRIGHPARVIEALRGHTLDERVDQDPSSNVIRDMRREVQGLVRQAGRNFRGRNARSRRRELFAEAGRLRGEIRRLERSVVSSIIDSAEVICSTTSLDDDLLGSRQFDLCVVDEACQCTIPAVWQVVLRSQRIVLAGDHCQLPPTVVSPIAANAGMRDSLMQRLVLREGESIYRRLTVQYRMHESIMKFSSDSFYDGSLIADCSVRDHRLDDLDHVSESPLTSDPITFIDTAGAEYLEQVDADGESKFNPKEAQLVLQLVTDLRDAGVAASDIAVIAPYSAQVRLLRDKFDVAQLEIDTVDGFQGREKEVVVISLVRSNERLEIGFLADTRRTNVAITRARRKLIVIGDSATIGSHPFYTAMLEYFESIGAYQTVWELNI